MTFVPQASFATGQLERFTRLHRRIFSSQGVFIVGSKRTAFGAFGGKLKDVGSVELGQIAARAAIEAAKISPEQIDSVAVGNIISVHSLGFC